MARLENAKGIYFDIKPIAYEFPEGDAALNWLQIRLQANDGKQVWEATNPAFENFELTYLIKWLRQLVSNAPGRKLNFYATEPCVEIVAKRTRGNLEIAVLLGYEFLPPKMRGGKDSYKKKARLKFTNDGENFLRFATELEKELELFPFREERGDD